MKKVIISLVIIVVLAIGFFAGYRYLYKKADQEFRLFGQLQISQVDVAFRVPGVIAHSYFSEGMQVSKDQLLAELNNETYLSQQKLAKANEDAAKWGLEELKDNLKKAGRKDENLVNKTQAQLDAATANRELADFQVNYTKLTSPIKGTVLAVYKEEGEIIGFVIFESSRSTHYLRYWFVHPKHRDKKIGSILLKTFFYEGRNTRRQLFWVITDNENAVKRYEHYGFKNEAMKDYVLTKNIAGGVKS